MKDKLSGIVNRGIGAVGVLLKCKLVSIIIFLFTGVLHIIDPRGGFRGTVTILSLFIALYAVLSFICVLTGSNSKVEDGKNFAGGMVREVFKGNGNPIVKTKEILSKNEKINEKISNSAMNARWSKRMQLLIQRHENKPNAGKVVMCIFYAILFAAAIILYISPDDTISTVHILLGGLLIFDGFSGIWGVIAARKSGIPMKGKLASALLNLLSVVIGLVFIFLSNDSADFTMVICGIVLVVKAVSDLVIIIRNKELISTVKNTVNEIKNGSPPSDDEDNNTEA